jgi:hypothetical protein
MFVKKHCTLNKKRLPYSCLTKKSLIKVAKKLSKVTKKKIPIHRNNLKKTYNLMAKIIKDEYKCNTEICWVKIKKLFDGLSARDKKIFRKHFKPKLPKEVQEDYKAWLSNFDIDEVMEGLKLEHKDFYYYSATPIDFHKCSVSDLCSIDIRKHHKKNKKKIGIVFNTDKSDGPGQHWIAMYIDMLGVNLDNEGIYYFDSYSASVPQQIKDLIEKLKTQGKDLDLDFIVTNNNHSVQRNNYACGYYCMHFIENMLRGTNFQEYSKKISDSLMENYKGKCFIHPNEIK